MTSGQGDFAAHVALEVAQGFLIRLGAAQGLNGQGIFGRALAPVPAFLLVLVHQAMRHLQKTGGKHYGL